MQINMPLPTGVPLSANRVVPSASPRAPRGVRQRMILQLEKMLKDHLSFSLEKVFTLPERVPVIADKPDFVPDIWVATLSRDPVRTRKIVEPGLIIEVQASANKTATFIGRMRKYRAIDSLREILVVDPIGRSFEIYRRASSVSWNVEDCNAASQIYLQTVDFEFAGHRLWPHRNHLSRTKFRQKQVASE